MLETISKCWSEFAIVAASGPSLTETVAQACRGYPVLAVNDAYRLLPFADALYACDVTWWRAHDGCKNFCGEKWSSHGNAAHNNKAPLAKEYGLRLVRGADETGFSRDPARIHYGQNSGFQGVNLAIHKLGGKGRIALVGFDLQMVGGRRHFFGDHPRGLRHTTSGYSKWLLEFARAAASLPAGLEIINCTPNSALTCFPMMDLADALAIAA